MALRTVVASLVLHAGVAAGLVAAGRGGHAVPGSETVTTTEVLEIDTSSETVPLPEPATATATAKAEDKAERANVVAPPPTHTHPYPVPGHDARPHDPSEPHDHAPADRDRDRDHDHDRDPASAESAAPAAPVATNEARATMPVFTMANGNGAMTAGSVRSANASADGLGNGRANAQATHAAEAAGVTYPVSSVSAPAKLVAGVTATYPPDARADDVEGDVGLEIVVDGEGRVVDARVVKRAGHGFDDAALVAIRRYRFSPAQREGRNVRVRMPWTVQFRLR